MFYIPLVLGLLVAGNFGTTGALVTLGGTAAFLAREPFMNWWRMWKRGGSGAPWTLAVYLAAATTAGAVLIFWAGRVWLLPMAVASAAVVWWHAEMAMRGRGRTVVAEVSAILASTLAAPAAYYSVSGILDQRAAAVWVLSAAYFASSVFYVKMRVTAAHAKAPDVPRRARRHCAIYHALLAAGMAAMPPLAALGFIPVLVRAFTGVLRPTRELNLKRIGWTEVVYSLVFLVLVWLALTPSSNAR
jgi:hypothetical protein